MSYRYSGFDIIIGVGLCAILFGALLFFVATTGMFLVHSSQSALEERLPTTESGWLQPALGQAIVQRALLQVRTDQVTASAMSEWNQAMQSHRSLLALSAHPFAFVRQRALDLPQDHSARVQTVMGRSIVNFTQRGTRSGVLSADVYVSDYNRGMIDATENRGRRMHEEFANTWQPMLGTWIVDASRDHIQRTADVQEQLGAAILHMTQAKTALEVAWSANQHQLGSLMAALDRTGGMNERMMQAAAIDTARTDTTRASAAMRAIPDVPIGYLAAAAVTLCSIFFGSVLVSAASREAKAMTDAKRNAGRWVYRMAS
jgi:hypothetical protein